jgi:hypothetical protein
MAGGAQSSKLKAQSEKEKAEGKKHKKLKERFAQG